MLDFMLQFCVIFSLLRHHTPPTSCAHMPRGGDDVAANSDMVCSRKGGAFPSAFSCLEGAPSLEEAVDQGCKEVCFQAQSIKSAELFAAEKYSDHEDERVETGKSLLSRAQRKRLKSKKLKEEQSDAMPAKKFIGPSLPDVLEKRRHEDLDCKSGCALLQDHGTPEKCRSLSNTEDREDVHDVREDEFLSTATEEEKHVHTAGELESLCNKTWEGKDEHDGVEPEPLSKAKRRRLAKKKFQDNLQRRAPADSLFTADIMGGDIVIKKMV